LGEAVEQVGQCEDAGSNSCRGSVVRALVRLAAYPYALYRWEFRSIRQFVLPRH